MNDRPTLSIVIPVYNEEGNVLLLYRKIQKVCETLGVSYEMVFVDDGSGDTTFRKLSELHNDDARIRVVRFRKNYGQTAAMAAGFEHARGKIVVSMDGDLQNDPVDIPRLLSKMDKGYDVVCGWRKKRQDKFWSRRLPSIVANWLIGKITGVNIHDNGCSLKAYRSSVIKNISLYGEMHRFIPAMATLAGARIAEIVVNHHPRRFGTSKYGISRIWRVILDIITVKMITGFASRPAVWFGLLGLPVIGLGVAILLSAGVMFVGVGVEEWMILSTVAFLFLFMGANLISMGIIAELSMQTGDYSPKKAIEATTIMD